MNFSKESKFGKYIAYFNGIFVIQKNIDGENYNFGYFDNIANATRARDILFENNWDDSKVPESLYSWRFFTRYHAISNSWEIFNIIGEDLIYFGLFKTVELAKKALKILIDNNWNTSYVPLEYYHKDSNIRRFKRPNGKIYYSVVRRINDSSVDFGSFEDYDEAIEFRNELFLNNWDLFNDEEEQFDDYIYFKDDVYRVKKDGIVYGEFEDIASAAEFMIECVKNNWKLDND